MTPTHQAIEAFMFGLISGLILGFIARGMV